MANLFLSFFLLYTAALVTTSNATRNGLYGMMGNSNGGGLGRRKLSDSHEEKMNLTFDPNNIAGRWRELHGENHWKGLVDPIDSDLQKYLLNYAAHCEATYESFDPRTTDCLFSMDDYFDKAGMVKGNPFEYKIVKWIYCSVSPFAKGNNVTAKPKRDSNWFGYIAVATDKGKKILGRRDIAVVWKGTVKSDEWIKDFEANLGPANSILGKYAGKSLIHQGFLQLYTSHTTDPRVNDMSAADQVRSYLQDLQQQYKDEDVSITVTGHSLGAAIAIVCAADIAANGHNKIPSGKTSPVAMINYGGPRVGDKNLGKAIAKVPGLRVLRVVNKEDFVVKIPPPVIYTHFGDICLVNNLKSPYLVMALDMQSLHMVEPAYLHTLATANGYTNLRSLACINKLSGSLHPKYKVPALWWKQPDRPFVQREDGSWVRKAKKLPGT